MAIPKPEKVDVSNYANDTVLLIRSITRVTSTPKIVEGEVSGTGKTISVGNKRIDTATVMAGGIETRDSYVYELYTPERMESTEEANYSPGPTVGVSEVSDPSDLPEPTHEVVN